MQVAILLFVCVVTADSCYVCSGSQLTTCTRCKGNWERTRVLADCKRCDGAGRLPCTNCRGALRIRCASCGGKGQLKKKTGVVRQNGWKRSVYSNVDCPHCHAGQRTCPTCIVPGLTPRSAASPGRPPTSGSATQGRGIVGCVTCKASGKRLKFGTCPACDSGVAECPRCRIHREYASKTPSPLPPYAAGMQQALVGGAASQAETLLTPAQAKANVGYWLEAIAEDDGPSCKVAREIGFDLIELLSQLEQRKNGELHFYTRNIPVVFASKDGGVVVLLDGVTALVPSVLGERSAEERRQAMLVRIGKDLITELANTVAPKVEYIGFELSYGAGPFVPFETIASIPIKTTTLVVPSSAAISFVEGQTSYNELLATSELYAVDSGRATRIQASQTP